MLDLNSLARDMFSCVKETNYKPFMININHEIDYGKTWIDLPLTLKKKIKDELTESIPGIIAYKELERYLTPTIREISLVEYKEFIFLDNLIILERTVRINETRNFMQPPSSESQIQKLLISVSKKYSLLDLHISTTNHLIYTKNWFSIGITIEGLTNYLEGSVFTMDTLRGFLYEIREWLTNKQLLQILTLKGFNCI